MFIKRKKNKFLLLERTKTETVILYKHTNINELNRFKELKGLN